ncbi:MAG: hypothetical protein M1829_000635 [Trizodia sp. TS-e1964]|nr:MAG: hypothetical protein M1829_000635 [Trizodia sp. TS-e1964]
MEVLVRLKKQIQSGNLDDTSQLKFQFQSLFISLLNDKTNQLEDAEDELGPENLDTLELALDVARLLSMKPHFSEEALALLRRVLGARIQRLGPNHSDTLSVVLHFKSYFVWMDQNLDIARYKADEEYAVMIGPPDPKIRKIYIFLGEVYFHQRRYKEAASVLRGYFSNYLCYLGMGGYGFISSLMGMVALAHRMMMDRTDGAEKLYQEVIDEHEIAFGLQHYYHLTAMNM